MTLERGEVITEVECQNRAEFEIYPQPSEDCEDCDYACRQHVGEFLPDRWAYIRPHPDVPGGEPAQCCYIGEAPALDPAEEATELACGAVRRWLHDLDPHDKSQGWMDHIRERFDREFPAAAAHGNQLAMEVCSYATTALLTNQPGWMTGLAKRINRYLESVGDESRVHFDGKRMWVKT